MNELALLDKSHAALRASHYELAHQFSMEVLQRNPRSSEAYFIMAMISRAYNNIIKAQDIITRALRFDGNNLDYQLFNAQCLLDLNRRIDARNIVSLLTIDQLKTAYQCDTTGVIWSRLGEHKRALDFFKKACLAETKNINYQYNLASCFQFSGDFESAENYYEKAIALDERHYKSHSSLSQLKKQTVESNHIKRLTRLWDTLPDDADAFLHVGHALSKEYEDLGDYGGAIHSLSEAKRRKRSSINYCPDKNSEMFKRLAGVVAQLHSSDAETENGYPSSEPIFIVGMPRTGTTLVERVLSSHSHVKSAGELANFSLLVKQAADSQSPWVLDLETVERTTALDFSALGQAYLDSTRPLTGDTPRFIDKMPLNFMYVPLILKALPQAKVICLRRNPMDTCLSNYRQLFSTQNSYYNYAYDLAHTARFYAGFSRLMDQCQEVLGGRFYQVHYEELVEDFEVQVRGLLAYCELPWQPQCLEFYDNRAPVATASSVQVREKLYRRGLSRWKHYAQWLAPLEKTLLKEGVLQNEC